MAEDDGSGVFSRSVSDLISQLRTSFRMKDFDEVEMIFVSRELGLKKELESEKKEKELLQGQHELLRNEKASIEVELEQLMEKAEEYLNLLDNDGNEAQNGEKRAVARFEKFAEELEAKKGRELQETTTIMELRDLNSKLELAKKRVEDELELWKNRFEELGTRVSILETKLPNIINGKPEISDKMKPPPENFSAAPAAMVGKNVVVSSGNGAESDVMIHIIDSDDELPAKALKGSGNPRGDQGTNVEDEPSVLKRKRALFDKT